MGCDWIVVVFNSPADCEKSSPELHFMASARGGCDAMTGTFCASEPRDITLPRLMPPSMSGPKACALGCSIKVTHECGSVYAILDIARPLVKSAYGYTCNSADVGADCTPTFTTMMAFIENIVLISERTRVAAKGHFHATCNLDNLEECPGALPDMLSPYRHDEGD